MYEYRYTCIAPPGEAETPVGAEPGCLFKTVKGCCCQVTPRSLSLSLCLSLCVCLSVSLSLSLSLASCIHIYIYI